MQVSSKKQYSPDRKILLTLLFTVGFDQFSKEAARFFGFATQFNSGISLSLLSSYGSELITAVLLIFIIGLWYGLRSFWTEHPVVAGLFFGGGISNLFDRAVYGAVRDWLPLPGASITNNLADWALFVAIGLLFWQNVQAESSRQRK